MKYRVFDNKGSFVQTYDSSLAGALAWARDCARHIGGTLIEYSEKEFSEGSEGSVVLDFRVERPK
jgi:hypothetical protein